MSAQASIFSVYAIELDDNPRRVYVGQTWHSPEARLKQHNTGLLENHAAKIFRKGARGKLRPDLYSGFPTFPTREAALRAEIILAKKLVRLGYSVHSDGLKKRKTQKVRRLFAHQQDAHRVELSVKELEVRKKASNGIPSTYRSDPFNYGRTRRAEKKREIEWVEKLRQKKLPIRETTPTILSDKAPLSIHIKPKIPKHSLTSHWNDNKKQLSKRFGTFNAAVDYANKISGRVIPLSAWRKRGSSYICKLEVAVPTFATGYALKGLRIEIIDTGSTRAGMKFVLQAKITRSI